MTSKKKSGDGAGIVSNAKAIKMLKRITGPPVYTDWHQVATVFAEASVATAPQTINTDKIDFFIAFPPEELTKTLLVKMINKLFIINLIMHKLC